MAEWHSASSECLTTGKRVGVLIAVREFGNTEGNKTGIPDRSLIQYPRGLHICDYEEEYYKGIRLVLRRGMSMASHVNRLVTVHKGKTTRRRNSMTRKSDRSEKSSSPPRKTFCDGTGCHVILVTIVQFRYIKIQSKTKGTISRLWGINSYKSLYLFPRASR